jgi:hypothetical protein
MHPNQTQYQGRPNQILTEPRHFNQTVTASCHLIQTVTDTWHRNQTLTVPRHLNQTHNIMKFQSGSQSPMVSRSERSLIS